MKKNNKNNERGTCQTCRHSNQTATDRLEGLCACGFGLGKCEDWLCSEKDEKGNWYYEPYDGKNCTWGRKDKMSILAELFSRPGLITLTGETGVRKTTLACNLAAHFSLLNDKETIYFSNCDCRHNIFMRFLSILTNTPFSDIADAAFDYKKSEKFYTEAFRIKNAPLHIIDGGYNSQYLTAIDSILQGKMIPSGLRRDIKKPKLIIIDNGMQLYDNSRKFRSGAEHYRSVLEKLKKMSKELKAAMLVIFPLGPEMKSLEKILGKKGLNIPKTRLLIEKGASDEIIDISVSSISGETKLSFKCNRDSGFFN